MSASKEFKLCLFAEDECFKDSFSLPISSYLPSMLFESRRPSAPFFRVLVQWIVGVGCCKFLISDGFFYGVFSGNVLQILFGPDLKKTSSILWCAVKALLVEIWFERNQRIFHNTASVWSNRFVYACLIGSSWCSMVKEFHDYSTQDIHLNRQAFIVWPFWVQLRRCRLGPCFCSV